MAVTMLNQAYTARVRPFRDSSVEVTIRWYRCPEGAKELPFLSCIQPLLWAKNPWRVTGPGEVYPVKRGASGGAAPKGVTGQSWCGSPEDFLLGGLYQPSRPPVRYTADGAALCCLTFLGGIVWGGTAPTAPNPGAVVWGGTAPAVGTTGGIVWGGAQSMGPFGEAYRIIEISDPGYGYMPRVAPGQDQWVSNGGSQSSFLWGPVTNGGGQWRLTVPTQGGVWLSYDWDGNGSRVFDVSGPGYPPQLTVERVL
jgi:hypothetical protein